MTEATVTHEIVEPNPSALIESLRSFGYSVEASVADLIDNSITAGATQITIQFEWNGPCSTVRIIDNGAGMSADELRDAMRPGSSSPLDAREEDDLGRFGLGLKTASFAQARRLTVVSRNRSEMSGRAWDLDHVGTTGRWELLVDPPDAQPEAANYLAPGTTGTVVLWSKMDRVVDERSVEDPGARAHFYELVRSVERHVAMVFGRFLGKGTHNLAISINDTEIQAWDPFIEGHRATQRRPLERLQTTQGEVRVQPYVLPHHSKLSKPEHTGLAGTKGWNAHQGFYIYRADRLIVAGTWFHGAMKAEEHHKLARIAVDISQEMDHSWHIDVRKSRARPPSALRDDLLRIARATRKQAEEVYRHRGKRISKRSGAGSHVLAWEHYLRGDQIYYRINRKHDVVRRALAVPAEPRSRVRALLDLVETTIPVPQIAIDAYEKPDRQGDHRLADLSGELIRAAEELLKGFREGGESPENAMTRLLLLEPFTQHPELASLLEEGADET